MGWSGSVERGCNGCERERLISELTGKVRECLLFKKKKKVALQIVMCF